MGGFLLDPGVAIYVALAAALACWIGVFIFLWRIDRATQELRRKLEERPTPEPSAPHVSVETRKTETVQG